MLAAAPLRRWGIVQQWGMPAPCPAVELKHAIGADRSRPPEWKYDSRRHLHRAQLLPRLMAAKRNGHDSFPTGSSRGRWKKRRELFWT